MNTKNNFNIVINKNILKENYDDNETAEGDEERRYLYSNKKAERKRLNISNCNSLVNSTRNLNNYNKQFTFNNEILDDNAKKANNYNYGSQGINNIKFIFLTLYLFFKHILFVNK